jgi:RNA polymerase subunit RPABC4/transcription elongation factor Spt4
VPKFTFECVCGLNFNRNLKVGEHPTHECPACHEEAKRVWEGFGVKFDPGTSAPANTGVSKLDYPTADQIVGSDADKRWETYQHREKVKKTVREKGGNRALIRKNGENYVEYTAGDQTLVKSRKTLTKELDTILKRPPA